MPADLSELARFRLDSLADAKAADLPNLVHLEPLKVPQTWTGRILCFDQALGNTGWAIIDCGRWSVQGEASLKVYVTGMFKQDLAKTGHEGSLRAAVALRHEVTGLMTILSPDLVVHELPPAGGRMARPESSLMAAAVVRIVADLLDIPVVMVGAQRAKKRFVGNGNATKAQVKGALEGHLPETKLLRPWNQDTADALAVGLVALEAL